MKNHFTFLLSSFLASAPFIVAQTVTLPQASPAASVTQRFGLTDVTVRYCRPSVRDREIWGELVPWGFVNLGFGSAEVSPWRAGANENTVFSTSTDITVEGARLPAGDYGLFMALDPSGEVTVIFSKDTDAWGSYFYDPAQDALRVKVQWEDTPFNELLTYRFYAVQDDATMMALEWEEKRIPLRLEADTPAIVMASLERELRGAKGFVNRSWVNAASYAVQHNIQLEKALGWINNALTGPFVGDESFGSYEVKSQILELLGRHEEAQSAMDQALEFGTVFDLHNYGRRMITEGNPQRALEVFQLNAKRHPGQWPVNFGLARAYSALSEFDTAIGYLEKAAANVPEGDERNATAITGYLAQLRKGEDIN